MKKQYYNPLIEVAFVFPSSMLCESTPDTEGTSSSIGKGDSMDSPARLYM